MIAVICPCPAPATLKGSSEYLLLLRRPFEMRKEEMLRRSPPSNMRVVEMTLADFIITTRQCYVCCPPKAAIGFRLRYDATTADNR